MSDTGRYNTRIQEPVVVVTYYARHGLFRCYAVSAGVGVKFSARYRHPASTLAAGKVLAARMGSFFELRDRRRPFRVEHVSDASWLPAITEYAGKRLGGKAAA